MPEVISYASPHAKQQAAPLATIRAMSLAVGVATLVIALCGLVSVFHEFSLIRTEATYEKAVYGKGAYLREFETRHDDSVAMAIVLSIFLPIAMLLVFAARALPRFPRRGFVMLWIYGILQFFGAIALGAVFVQSIYHSPAGMICFIGAIPGLLACAYPTFLLIYLPFAADGFMAPA